MTPLPPTTPPPAGTPTETPTPRTEMKCRGCGQFSSAQYCWHCVTNPLLMRVTELERELAAALKERDAYDKRRVEAIEQVQKLTTELAAEKTAHIKTLGILNAATEQNSELRQQLAGAEEAKGEVEANFNCFRCHDGHTPLYCLNCAGDLLKQSAWAQEAKVLLGEIAEVIETWAVGRHIMYSDRITGLLPRIKQAAQQSAPAPLKSDAL